jgi:hypothetical protein
MLAGLPPAQRTKAQTLLDNWEKQRAEIVHKKSEAAKTQQEIEMNIRRRRGDAAVALRDVYNYDQTAIQAVFAKEFEEDPEGVGQLWRMAVNNPELQKRIVDMQIAQHPDLEAVTLGPGEKRTGPTGFVSAEGGKRPVEPPKDFEAYKVAYARDVAGGVPVEQLTAPQLEDARKRYLQADDRARQAPTVVFQGGLVNKDTGVWQPIVDEKGRRPKPPPTAEMRNKQEAFRVGRTVFNELVGLAREVKRSSGVWARAKAPADRAAAKFNLDQSLKLYNDFVSGFSPMLARTIGHTGVLTDIDLLRTENILPGTGESGEIAEAKITRATNLLDKIEKTMNAWEDENMWEKPDGGGGGGGGTVEKWEFDANGNLVPAKKK